MAETVHVKIWIFDLWGEWISQLCKLCCVTTGLIKRASNDPYRQPRQLQDLWFHQRSSHQKIHSTAEYCSTLRIAALSMFFFPSLIIIICSFQAFIFFNCLHHILKLRFRLHLASSTSLTQVLEAGLPQTIEVKAQYFLMCQNLF